MKDVVVQSEHYARNALLQLRRVRHGSQIEEDHMRNRHMIVSWLIAHTSAIEVRHRDGKSYFVMTDVQAFRQGVGRLLAEVQRIKAEGDYEAAMQLFDTYGVHLTRRCGTKSWPASMRSRSVLFRVRDAAYRGALR